MEEQWRRQSLLSLMFTSSVSLPAPEFRCPEQSPSLGRSTDEGFRPQTGTVGKPFSCSMGEEGREPHHASLTAGMVL
jgi:hypothetical protein